MPKPSTSPLTFEQSDHARCLSNGEGSVPILIHRCHVRSLLYQILGSFVVTTSSLRQERKNRQSWEI